MKVPRFFRGLIGLLAFLLLITPILNAQSYISLGSSSSDVRKILGEPTDKLTYRAFNEEEWLYGISSITFKNDSVVAWSNFDKLQIRVISSPPTYRRIQRGFNKVNLAGALGTPSLIQRNVSSQTEKWFFGSSQVLLKNGIVDSFIIDPQIYHTVHHSTRESKYQPHKSRKSTTTQNTDTGKSLPKSPTLPIFKPESRTNSNILPTTKAPSYSPPVAENGSYYGETSKLTGRPKTVHVNGYYRKDGTYVRGHYRSSPRRR